MTVPRFVSGVTLSGVRVTLLAGAIAAAACSRGGGEVAGSASASGHSSPQAVTAADVPLIPRRLLFGNPEKTGPTLSDDGRQIAFRAAVNGVMNVWVGPADAPDAAKPVTKDAKRSIRQYFWAYTNQHIVTCRTRAATRTGASIPSTSRPGKRRI